MDLKKNWPKVVDLFERANCIAVASLNRDGSPHISPIHSIMLRDDCTGFYMERFPTQLPGILEYDARICVYAARLGNMAWFKAMRTGRFDWPPAVRLLGRVGERRDLSDEEHGRWLHKVRMVKWSKGYKILWAKKGHARELVFDGLEPVNLGPMTKGLWD